MSVRPVLFVLLLAGYGVLFSLQEARFSGTDQQLAYPLPPTIQKSMLGYLRQLGGEMQFIKASVFYGGVRPGRDPLEYAAPLARHLSAAAGLHPHFLDTYFFSQATLPHISNEYAAYANQVLAQGMAALPDNLFLPFFVGFNYFYYLKDNQQGARFLYQTAQHPDAPSWIGHLAGMLAGEGGDIYGGLFWLRAMLATEEDELMRQRYQRSISMFERAVTVQQAIEQYRARYGQDPPTLNDLAPAILPALPELEPPFRLVWEPPALRLLREKPTSRPASSD